MLNYTGDIAVDKGIPMAGVVGEGADASSWAHGLTMLWRPSWGQLGGNWSYAMSATIPYVFMDVEANVVTGTSKTIRRFDRRVEVVARI